jgi:DNA-binding MarR family transcriptional regulator
MQFYKAGMNIPGFIMMPMKIEEAIKQKKFRNEYQKFSVNLIYSAHWLLSRQKEIFSRFKITPQQYNVLRILRGQYPGAISTSEIKSRMLDMNSDSSRIVDRLELKNLVTKKICRQDKRLVDVSVSNAGLKMLDRIDQESEKLDRIVSKLSEGESRTLNHLLDKMRG